MNKLKYRRGVTGVALMGIIAILPQKSLSQWEKTGDLTGKFLISTLAASGKDIAVGTFRGDIYLSQDTGNTWTWLNEYGEHGAVKGLYLNGDTVLSAGDSGGVYLFSKNGYTWGRHIGEIRGDTAFCFAVAGNTVFAGASAGLFLSTDKGATWAQVDSQWAEKGASAFCIDGNNLFAGTRGNGIYASQDNGQRWIPKNSGLSAKTYVASLAVAGGRLYAAMGSDSTVDDSALTQACHVFVSGDSGSTWNMVNQGFQKFNSMLQIGSAVWAGTPDGLFRSIDHGANWTKVNSGMQDASITSLAKIGNTLFAGSRHLGIFQSLDSGTTWKNASSLLTDMNVHSLTVHGNNLFAGTHTSVLLSTDNGANWTGCSGNFYNVRSLASMDSLVIAGFGIGWGTSGIYISADNGFTWRTDKYGPTTGPITSIAIKGNYIFAGEDGYEGMFRSGSGGTSWSSYNSGLIVYHGISSYNVNVFSIGTVGSAVVTGTDEGIYYSNDDGAHWDSAGYCKTVCAFAAAGTTIFAATGKNGVLLSSDFGKTWASINSGLGNLKIFSLATYGKNIFAGADSGGVFLSSNNGASWTTVSSGLNKDTVEALTVKGDTLYAGLSGSGVWRLPLSGVAPVLSPAPAHREGIDVTLNLRQGAAPVFWVTLPLACAQRVQVALYGVRGNRLFTLVDKRMNAGHYRLKLDARAIASGYYVVRLQTQTLSMTKRIFWTR